MNKLFHNFRYIFIFTLLITSYSCSEDDPIIEQPTVPRPDGRTVVPITSISDVYGVWRFEGIYVDQPVDLNGDGVRNTNALFEFPSCALDDRYVINVDGTYDFIDNNMTCNEQDRRPLGPTGRYTLNENNSIFFFREGDEATSVETFSWGAATKLEDPNYPEKRYLEFGGDHRALGFSLTAFIEERFPEFDRQLPRLVVEVIEADN